MIIDYKNINPNLKQQIITSFYDSYRIDSLREMYPSIDYNVLYSIIYSTGLYNVELNNQLYQMKIDDDIIIFISDTHDGSVYENRYYKDKVFDFAIANGVRTIFHGGDFLQGYYDNFRNITKCKYDLNQAQNFIDRYPSDPTIMTYGVYGNHDYKAINNDEFVKNVLESRNDIVMMGFKKVYILWRGYIISLQHNIDSFPLCLPMKGEYLSFKGHSHFYHVRPKSCGLCERVYLPALCDEAPKNKQALKYIQKHNLQTTPCFVTAEDYDNCILISYFSFKYGTIVREDEYIKEKTKKLIIK